MDKWIVDYEKLLLAATGYSGNKKKEQKLISASSLGNDMLQLYLDYRHGKTEDKKFEASNVGSMFQLGVDKACGDAMEGFENPQYISAKRFTHTLPNGWVVSGEIDQLDTVNKVIIDNKVSTATAKKKVLTEGLGHQYALQLGVYKYLVHKNLGEDYSGALAFVDKSASYFKPTSGDTMNYMNVKTYDYEEIEELLIKKSNELQEYIDLDEEPGVCENRFPFKSKSITKMMRCIHYCSFNQVCEHYNPNTAAKSFAENLNLTDTKINQFEF